jgi:hypothetical protein
MTALQTSSNTAKITTPCKALETQTLSPEIAEATQRPSHHQNILLQNNNNNIVDEPRRAPASKFQQGGLQTSLSRPPLHAISLQLTTVQWYKSILEQYKMTSPLEGLFSKLDNSMEIQVCRDNLFDKTLVVDQVNSQTEDN